MQEMVPDTELPGSRLGLTRPRLAVALAAALAAVAADLLIVSRGLPSWTRTIPFAAAVALYGHLAGWNGEALGLRIRPAKGLVYWVKAALVMGALVLAACGGAWLVLRALGRTAPMPTPFGSRAEMLNWLLSACVAAPIVEEGVYRFALCLPVAAAAGKWPAILVSGAAFAALHFVAGNPSPDNIVAGFLFAWAFLESRSLLVPIALHSLGNLCVGAVRAYLMIAGGPA